VLAALVLVVGAALGLASAAGTSESPRQRADRLSGELRCPVCQGLSVADSPSSTARAMAADVRRRVAAGESDSAIRADFVRRYGEPILLTPAGAPAVLAWGLPVLVLGVGALLVVVTVRRGSAASVPVGDSAEDARVVRELRARLGGAGQQP
jgi:cytochrome c-type biogenesis protein CcmH